MMEEADLRFGDIITNGINYWMVTTDMMQGCLYCGCNGVRTIKLTPVIAQGTKSGEIIFTHLQNERHDMKPSDVKPYWTLVRRLHDGLVEISVRKETS